MGRLSNLRQTDPVLTNLASGYANDEFVGEALLPVVDIDKEGAKIPKFGKEAFYVYQTERALRAKSNTIAPEDTGSVSVSLDEHDLQYPVDYREDAEAAFDVEAHATYRSTEGILLRREKLIATMAQDPATYPVGNKIALSGASVFTDATSDPESVIATGRAAVRSKVAKEPNTMLAGYIAFKALERHPKLRAIVSDTRSRLLTVEDLAAIFGVRRVVVGRAISVSDTGVSSDIWGGNVVLAYVAAPGFPGRDGTPMRSPYEPSFGYTLRKRSSSKVDVHVTEGGKVEMVRYTEIYRPYILGADAGYLITGAA